jgi:chromatin remodeling complex protein RSC6
MSSDTPTNAKFMAPLTPDAALAAVIGTTPLPRTEIVKQLWVYIKANGLQDPADKRTIVADAKLKLFFNGADRVNMMKLGGFISDHVAK